MWELIGPRISGDRPEPPAEPQMSYRCSLWNVHSLERYYPYSYQTFRALSEDPTLYLYRIKRYAPQKRCC